MMIVLVLVLVQPWETCRPTLSVSAMQRQLVTSTNTMQALSCPISPLPLLPSTLGSLFRLLTEGDPPADAPSGSGSG
jgi:hypothetical protein